MRRGQMQLFYKTKLYRLQQKRIKTEERLSFLSQTLTTTHSMTRSNVESFLKDIKKEHHEKKTKKNKRKHHHKKPKDEAGRKRKRAKEEEEEEQPQERERDEHRPRKYHHEVDQHHHHHHKQHHDTAKIETTVEKSGNEAMHDDDDTRNHHVTTRRRTSDNGDDDDGDDGDTLQKEPNKNTRINMNIKNSINNKKVTFAHRYILAPMVGASELAFRLLCRKYGAQLAYTPMMSAHEFAYNEQYRRDEFFVQNSSSNNNNSHHHQHHQHVLDRPLVCHFSANTPQDFAAAAKAARPYCDAIDLNLGCPQRTAYIGHFGSYLLDPKDRQLIYDMIRAAVSAVNGDDGDDPIPIFCKIRLLPTLEETIQLCRQLAKAGASLIAIHARYRASWERKGAGARDGPALLDQVLAIKQAMLAASSDDDDADNIRNVLIVANGNSITYDDVQDNLNSTRADGLMSAEGILDNPALFLPRLGTRQEADKVITIPAIFGATTTNANATTTATTALPDTKSNSRAPNGNTTNNDNDNGAPHHHQQQQELDRKQRGKRARKLNKKLREIARIEKRAKKSNNGNKDSLEEEEHKKLQAKESIQQELRSLLLMSSSSSSTVATTTASSSSLSANYSATATMTMTTTTTLGALYQSSDDKFQLAMEYLDLAEAYPVKMRSVIFHIRRMLKESLTNYQLLEECLTAPSIAAVRGMIQKMQHYRDNPDSFIFDQTKALQEKEALERKRREEGKRKEYEARMIRKAKREGKTGKDLFHYLQIGSTVPRRETIQHLRPLPRTKALTIWQEKDHAQHCVAFHLDPKGCARGRTCAFLHVDISSSESSCQNAFIEKDEVAG